MEKITVRSCALSELTSAPNFKQLIDAYAAESALPVLGKPNTDMVAYQAMDAAGILNVLIAVDSDDTVVGFVGMITVPSPHYGVLISSTESLFVLPEFRVGGTCQKLLALANEVAMQRGAAVLVVSAPISGALDKVLPRWGFSETYRFYSKRLQ